MDGSVRELVGAMRDEIACFDDFSREQKAMGKAVRARDWISLQKSLISLEAISGCIRDAETRREGLYRAACEALEFAGDSGFYQFSLRVAEPVRSELGDAFRNLKVAAVRTRIENDVLGESIDDSRALLTDVFEELFPDRKGKLYGKSGKAVGRNLESVVINTAM